MTASLSAAFCQVYSWLAWNQTTRRETVDFEGRRRLDMLGKLRRFRFLVVPLLAIVLLAANLQVYTAHAHNWGRYHWNKTGPAIYVYQFWERGNNYAAAERARV